jgi:hypothetical protein
MISKGVVWWSELAWLQATCQGGAWQIWMISIPRGLSLLPPRHAQGGNTWQSQRHCPPSGPSDSQGASKKLIAEFFFLDKFETEIEK